MKKTIGIVIGIGLALLLGCARGAPTEATLATSVDDVVGVWRGTPPLSWGRRDELYIEFKTDGTFRISTAADTLEDQPDGEGEFWFEGTQFHWKDITGAVYGISLNRYSWRECAISNPTAIYEVMLLPNGYLKFARIQDKCSWRTQILTEMGWEPVR